MRRSALGAVVVGAALTVAGCSSTDPSSPGPAVTSSGGTGSGSSSSTSPTTTTATSTRSPDVLKAALLGAPDLPQGYVLYPDQPTGTVTVSSRTTSSDPACAPFLELVKDPPKPLPANQAKIEFGGGENFKPPSVLESIQAFPTASAAAAELAQERAAVAACPSVTYTLDDMTSPVSVRQEAPPELPVPALGIRLTADTGGLKGYDAKVVTMQVGDAVVSMTLLKATPEQLTSLTSGAAAKAAKVLGTG